MTSTTATFEMPDWFSHLVKDVMVQATPYQHFGSAWGGCVENTIEIHATTIGKWHVLITAARADHCATSICEQQVEYIPEVPERERNLFRTKILNNENAQTDTGRFNILRATEGPTYWPEGGRVYCTGERYLRNRTDAVFHRKSSRSNGSSIAINLSIN